MYSNMFQIYHDEENTKNVNLLNHSKHNIMMREKKIISSERNKKNILSSITNNNNVIFINEKTDRMKNHIHQQKTQSIKIQKKKQQLNKKKKKREDKDLKSKKLKKKKKKKKQKQKSNNVLTSDTINNNHHPVVQYANTTSTIANQWEQEIEVIINMPIVNEEKILCYVQVYDEEVKTKYFNSVSRNLLSIYPQWQYIFEQQYNKNRQNYGNNNILSENFYNHRTRTFINYVNVYDMRCKDQYYQLVKSNMFKKFPQWRSVFSANVSFSVRKKQLALEKYKREFNSFWQDDENDVKHREITTSMVKRSDTHNKSITGELITDTSTSIKMTDYKKEFKLFWETTDESNTSANEENVFKKVKKYQTRATYNLKTNAVADSFQTTTLYVILLLICFFVSPVKFSRNVDDSLFDILLHNQNGIKYEAMQEKLEVLNSIEPVQLVSHVNQKKISNNKEPLQQTTTTTASDRPKIGSTNIALKKQSMDLNKPYTKIMPIKLTPYPSSSKFYLKYGVVVETNAKNIVINNNIEKKISLLSPRDYPSISSNTDTFDIKITKANVKTNYFDMHKPRKMTKQNFELNKIINLSTVSRITMKNTGGKESTTTLKTTATKPMLNMKQTSKMKTRNKSKKVMLQFSSNLIAHTMIQSNIIFSFQVHTMAYIEKYSKICVFVEDVNDIGTSVRRCKTPIHNNSDLAKQNHISEFKLKFSIAGIYNMKALLLHPRNGKLGEINLNNVNVRGDTNPKYNSGAYASFV